MTRVRQSGVRVAPARHRASRSRAARARGGRQAGIDRALAAQAPRALRRAAAASWPSAARSCAIPRCSCSTSRCPISTPRCACSTRNELIKQQQEIGTTSIYVTHDQVEAMTMGDRICIMNQGKVVQIGRPLEVYRNPADTFVARFLGNPPMNLLPGRIEQRGRSRGRATGGGGLALPMRTATALGRYVGGDVIVGVRPEDLYESVPPGDPVQFARLPVTRGCRRAAGRRDPADGDAGGLRGGADRAHRARHGVAQGRPARPRAGYRRPSISSILPRQWPSCLERRTRSWSTPNASSTVTRTSSIRSAFRSPARRATSRAPDERGTREAFCAVLDEHGVSNGVLVQLSGYGTDNSANLDAMKSYPGRFKAIAVVDPDADRSHAREPGGRRGRRRAIQPPQLRTRRADAARRAAVPAAAQGAGMVRADLRRRRAMAGGRAPC